MVAILTDNASCSSASIRVEASQLNPSGINHQRDTPEQQHDLHPEAQATHVADPSIPSGFLVDFSPLDSDAGSQAGNPRGELHLIWGWTTGKQCHYEDLCFGSGGLLLDPQAGALLDNARWRFEGTCSLYPEFLESGVGLSWHVHRSYGTRLKELCRQHTRMCV